MVERKKVVLLENVSTAYEGERISAIRDVDISVHKGDFVCIVGPNGSGKTTLLETINGILRYTSGHGSVFGLEIISNGSAIRKRIGYVIQNFEIDPLSPFLCKNVVMSGRTGKIGLLRFPDPNDWNAVRQSMGRVGMESWWSRPVGKLSGGEFQKILIARALAQEPDIFLLDEPYANLDIRSRHEIGGLFREIHDAGSTLLMVSHDVSSIPSSCTHIIVMNRGRVVGSGSTTEVIKSGIIDKTLVMRGPSI
ncbi:MAG: metal ABC transporter ATP-binding protein [Methanobacteriota archaeon]|nr:MAG: metal ABC transporter ATP-binding protein [Euryarchaeota archaeon]